MKNLVLILIAFLLTSCAIKEPRIIEYKQDLTPFTKDIESLDVDIGKFYKHYYKPWNLKSLQISKKRATWANRVFFKDRKFFSENTLTWDIKEIAPIINSTNFQAYNSVNLYAITSKFAQIRNLPTNKPFFRSFKKAGEGYPFDYLQNSRIHINSPLLISHYSNDGSWAFVKTPFSYGWLPTNSIAPIGTQQIEEFKKCDKVVITSDNTAIYTKHQKFFTTANLGAIFPVSKEDDEFYHSYAFVNCFDKNSKKIDLVIPKKFAKKFPLAFNAQNIKKVANALLNQRYGWGGYLGNRDCSAMTKDFLRLFGLWIPRNSASQKRAGEYISLDRKSDEEKERIIAKYGIPFRTLIYLKGHIMLYIGQKDGRAVVLQNLWGLRTKNGKKIGRYIIGRAIISDLYLGENLTYIDKKSMLIKRVRGITIIK